MLVVFTEMEAKAIEGGRFVTLPAEDHRPNPMLNGPLFGSEPAPEMPSPIAAIWPTVLPIRRPCNPIEKPQLLEDVDWVAMMASQYCPGDMRLLTGNPK